MSLLCQQTALGVRFCPTCKQDTLPNRYGVCFFCDSVVVEEPDLPASFGAINAVRSDSSTATA